MRLTHPDSAATIEVRSDLVDNYRTQGWTEAKPKRARTRPPKSPVARTAEQPSGTSSRNGRIN